MGIIICWILLSIECVHVIFARPAAEIAEASLFSLGTEVELNLRDFVTAERSINCETNGSNLTECGENSTLEVLESQKDFFEGDLLFVGPQSIKYYVDLINTGSIYSGLERNAVRDVNFLWPRHEIPYALSPAFTPEQRGVIAAAFLAYTRHTCVRFVPRKRGDFDYVYLTIGRGCASAVGRQGGRQDLFMAPECFIRAVVMHELLHVLGVFHEHSRADRDQYVDIQWNNIQPQLLFNFQKYTLLEISHLGVPYDYDSVMHYGPRAFTRNGLDTIVPRKRDALIGQKVFFSETDIFKINKLYRCADVANSGK